MLGVPQSSGRLPWFHHFRHDAEVTFHARHASQPTDDRPRGRRTGPSAREGDEHRARSRNRGTQAPRIATPHSASELESWTAVKDAASGATSWRNCSRRVSGRGLPRMAVRRRIRVLPLERLGSSRRLQAFRPSLTGFDDGAGLILLAVPAGAARRDVRGSRTSPCRTARRILEHRDRRSRQKPAGQSR